MRQKFEKAILFVVGGFFILKSVKISATVIQGVVSLNAVSAYSVGFITGEFFIALAYLVSGSGLFLAAKSGRVKFLLAREKY